MKQLLAGLLFMFGMAVGASAQTPITVGQSGNGTGSGSTFYFYTVPMTIGGVAGTADVYPQGQGGFILFRPPLDGSGYAMALVTGTTIVARDSMGRTTQLAVSYSLLGDPNGDGDTDTVQGTITFNIGYVLGGRWHNLTYPQVTGGSGAQSITQD